MTPRTPSRPFVISSFQAPQVMAWTLLPARVIATSWVDASYRAALLAHPGRMLRAASSLWPADRSFVVVADTPDCRHFVLPCLPEGMAPSHDKTLLSLLQEETGHDRSFRTLLSAEVLVEAYTDPNFKASLFRDGRAALGSRGVDLGVDVVILENTPTTHHLVLPLNPSQTEDIDFDSLYERLVAQFGAAPSSQCCASGTCDPH